MRLLLTILTTLLTLSTWANMASPIMEGTLMTSPFISQHVEIVKETILIIPDSRFSTARFEIEYHIQTAKSGTQIPLLFYASEFRENFRIWLDGEAIELQQVPGAYQKLAGTPFTDFGYFFDPTNGSGTRNALIDESPSSSFLVSIDDLKFFETDLSAGTHLIRVEYVADHWTDRSDWVKEQSFRYALSPAKYWKSFGELEITLDASNFDQPILTNLGEPELGLEPSTSVWTFSALPTDVLQLSYQPKMNATASTLLAISPRGLAGLLGLMLAAIHLLFILRYRKAHPNKKLSWPVIVGSLLVPFLTLAAYVYAFELIDMAIGPQASKYHGYPIFAMGLYPIVLPIYGGVMWGVDWAVRKKLSTK